MCGGCILLFSVMLMWYISIGWCKVGGGCLFPIVNVFSILLGLFRK